MSEPGVPSWVGDLDHLNALSEAALATDTDGRIVYANDAALRLHRVVGDDGQRLPLGAALLPEGQPDLFSEIIRQVLGGVPWTGRLEVSEVDGSLRLADVGCSPLRRGGLIEGVVCIVDDSGARRGESRKTRRLEDRLTRLARVAAELGAADDVQSVTQVVIAQAADAVGATVASLSVVVDDDTLALVGMRGGRDGASMRWATYSRHGDTPAADVVRTGEVLVLVGDEEISARYPALESAAEGPRTIVGLPLKIVGQAIGVVTLSFPGRRQLDVTELEFFAILADSCAQALERLRVRDEAAEQTRRVQFLATAATELARSLDYEKTMRSVARLAVPAFADWCTIDIVEDDRLHRVAVAHVDPGKVQLALELAERFPADRDAPGGTWEVIHTGNSVLLPRISDELLAANAKNEEHLRLLRELRLHSAVQVPLVVRDRVLGVITWVTSETRREYAASDVTFAEDLAKRCATALDNSQLYSQTMEAAVRLQHAVMPDLAGDVAGWELASYYSPAGRTEVGGDFFDAIELPDGRLALFVGDVMGRGVAAAAAMAQMRASIRAFVAVDPEPEAVLRKLDQLFSTYEMTQLVTLVYLVADPARDELALANAGHPPPVVLRSDGTTEQLPSASGAPLGLEPGAREVVRIPFRAEDTVIAFTDGVIERRNEDIDIGQQRLLDAVPLLARRGIAQTLPEVVESVRDHTRDDDVAALVARRLKD